MARTQRTPYVILGLLGLSDREPRSGYEIKKAIDSVISHFWSESHGQLYPVLKQLAAEELIRAQDRQEGRRKKTVYAITPKGKKWLRSWLEAPIELGKPRDELILKLFFGSETEIPVLIRHLEAHRARMKTVLHQCEQWKKENAQNPDRYSRFFLITINAGTAVSEASLRWAEDSLQMLKAMRAKPTKS
jgi:PadR family transcriptional regulator AphA